MILMINYIEVEVKNNFFVIGFIEIKDFGIHRRSDFSFDQKSQLPNHFLSYSVIKDFFKIVP